jgi:D-arabinose 1-dehydrogenase-like Zn-dependent alcohol dehydrogenase
MAFYSLTENASSPFQAEPTQFDPIEVTPIQLISGSKTIQGWAAGTAADSEDTLRFAELSGVRPMIETYPLEKAAEAYARMMSGNAQFRVVLTM